MKIFEPIKIVLLLLILFWVGMNYWSSSIVEEQVFSLKRRVDLLETQGVRPATQSVTPQAITSLGKSDPSLPNLLLPDPFVEKTLPELLGAHFKRYPVLFDATVGKPENLNPLSGWANVSTWIARCTGTAATSLFGKYETLSPSFAWKMEERKAADGKSVEYWIHLRNDIFWEPLSAHELPNGVQLADHFLQRRPVTAQDFKFEFDLLMNPFNQEMVAITVQGKYSDITSFEVIDPQTFVVRWASKAFTNEKGETVYKPKYVSKLLTGGLSPAAEWVWAYRPDGTRVVAEADQRTSSSLIEHMQLHWAKNIIPSCGPFTFIEMSDESIRFKRNANYFDPLEALYDEWEVAMRASFDSIWNDFKLGKISTYALNASQIPDWERFKTTPEYEAQKANGEAINVLSFPSNSYYFVGWNMKRPLFTSKKVRQALTLAIDRPRILREILYGQGFEITGTFPPNSPATNPDLKPWPYDPDLARKMLAEEGWADLDRDGVLEKEIDGKKVIFSFKLIYANRGPVGKATVEAIVTQLKKVGIRAELVGLELTDLNERMNQKDFDALYLGWVNGSPPEDPRQIWSSSGVNEVGSANYVGFANAEADKIIDDLDYESDKAKRIELYHRFDDILYDEQPYTFLFSLYQNLLYREYIGNVFIPKDRQDLVPGANVDQPVGSIFFDKRAMQE